MKIFVLLFISGLLILPLPAQKLNGIVGLSYQMGQTAFDTKEYIDDFSWRGFGIDFRNFLKHNLSVGLTVGWNIFDEKNTDLLELENGAISGTQIRYINALPVQANAHYYFGSRRRDIRPYAGLNLGAYFITQRLEIGVFSREVANWHFGLAPEVGLLVKLNELILIPNIRLNHAFPAGESISKEKQSYSYWGLNIAFVIPMY